MASSSSTRCGSSVRSSCRRCRGTAARSELGWVAPPRRATALTAAMPERRLATVPGVLAVRTDRDFPHTLKLVVTPERAVLLLRQGKAGWVISARGRVLGKVKNTRVSSLPRLWVGKDASVKLNVVLTPE